MDDLPNDPTTAGATDGADDEIDDKIDDAPPPDSPNPATAAPRTFSALHAAIFGDDDESDLSDVGKDSDDDLPAKEARPKKLVKKSAVADGDAGGSGGEVGEEYRPLKLPKIKKRKKSEDEEEQDKKAKKKRQPRKDAEEQPEGEDGTPTAAAVVADDFEAALERIKTKRSKRRGDGDDTAFDDEIQHLIQQMDQAAANDVADNENQKPAINKIKLLPVINEKLLSKAHLYNKLIDNQILTSMRLWLEPLRDGSLPNLDVQWAVLSTLGKMTIGNTILLRESKIGGIIMFYTKCDRVVPGIQKMARELVDKWIRVILDRPKSYKERTYTAVPYDVTKKSEVKVRPAAENSHAPNHASNRTVIPKPVTMSFDYVPASNVMVERGERGKANQDSIRRKMKQHIQNLKRKK